MSTSRVSPSVDVRLASLVANNTSFLSYGEVLGQLHEVSNIRAWLDARETALTARLLELGSGQSQTGQEISAYGRRVSRDASRVVERAELTDQMPQFLEALSEGTVTAEHTDALVSGLKKLNTSDRATLCSHADDLLRSAKKLSAPRFSNHVRKLVDTISAAEANERFELQRKSIYLKHWSDDNGMIHLRGAFDPERGSILIGRLRNAVEAMFHCGEQVETAPGIDPNHHRAALALLRLTEVNNGINPENSNHLSQVVPTSSQVRAEVSVIVDLKTLQNGLHECSTHRTTNGVDLPADTIRRIACDAAIIPIVLNGEGVVIDVGRAKRLATSAQRRSLEAMYQTCAIPGCEVSVTHCVPHHIHYWEHGGRTDMQNLVPLCSRHHHASHEGGWKLSLSAERKLQVVLPDGRILDDSPFKKPPG